MRCIRTERYKYIQNFTDGFLYQNPGDISGGPSGRAVEASRRRLRPREELYDLRADPHEMDNLAGKPEVAGIESELRRQVERWMETSGDFLPGGFIPWPNPGEEHFLNNMDFLCPARTDYAGGSNRWRR